MSRYRAKMETVEATAVEIVAATAANDGENGAVMTVEESSVDNSSWMKSGSAAAPGEPAMAEPSFPTEVTTFVCLFFLDGVWAFVKNLTVKGNFLALI